MKPDPTASLFPTILDPDYDKDVMKPIPGDLVISCLEDIRHPARHVKLFGKHFLIIGTVIGFTQIAGLALREWKKCKTFEQLMNKEHIINNARYIQISSKNKSRKFVSDVLEDNFVPISPCSPKVVRVLKKGHSGILQDLNDYMLRNVVKLFDWSSNTGWNYNPDRH